MAVTQHPDRQRHDADPTGGLHAFVADSPALAPTGSGQLDGVDVAVKDLFAVEGHVSSFGHPAWRHTHEPAETTAPAVARLLDAGASVVGLTKLEQLAYSLVGNVGEGESPVNPRRPELWCGGSSSGSASAVAASRAHLGLGTDTAGSVRVPAAMCGIHGLRPTWGRLDTAGVVPLAASFDTVGLLAANPRVLRLGFGVLDAPGLARDPAPIPAMPQRILVPAALDGRTTAAACVAVERAAVELATALDATVVPVDLDELVNAEVGQLLARLQGRQVWANHGAWALEHLHELDEDVAARLMLCSQWAAESSAEVDVDERDQVIYRALWSGLLEGDAVAVLPVLGADAPRRDDPADRIRAFRSATFALMAPASLSGFPQLTWSMRPQGVRRRAPDGLAVGLLGAHGADLQLLEILARVTVT